MPSARRMTEAQKREWKAQFHLAETFHQKHVKPTCVFVDAFKNNEAQWPILESDDLKRRRITGNWPYEAVTANLLFAGFKSTEPRVIMRHPRAVVKPSSRVTRTFQRAGTEQPNAILRLVASAIVQAIVNWRIREFDFKGETRRAHFDDYFRGFGLIRHGYTADTSRMVRDREIHTQTHQKIRPGWPFAVHQPLELYRSDPFARCHDERQWAGYGRYHRLEDLKANQRFTIPRSATATEVLGKAEASGKEIKFYDDYADVLGRVCVWEIWDLRRREVVHWVPDWDTAIGVEDWPESMEGIDGLPDTILMTNRTNESQEPIPEPDLVWDLLLTLNKLTSLLLVYAKRGVPVIGAQSDGMEDDEMQKLTDAEVMEVIQTKGIPNQVVHMLNLQPNMAGLLQAIAVVRELIREVSGQSRLNLGTRENVETAAEANAITFGGDIRTSDRAEAVRELISNMVRKDWQIFQASVSERQYIEIADTFRVPFLFSLTPDQIRYEFDFEIAVGSTQPLNPDQAKRDALAIIEAFQSAPELKAHSNPRYFSQLLVKAFELDESEALAPQDAAFEQRVSDALMQLMPGEQNGGGPMNLGSALDAIKMPMQGGMQ